MLEKRSIVEEEEEVWGKKVAEQDGKMKSSGTYRPSIINASRTSLIRNVCMDLDNCSTSTHTSGHPFRLQRASSDQYPAKASQHPALAKAFEIDLSSRRQANASHRHSFASPFQSIVLVLDFSDLVQSF